jgi:glycine cleavage system H protein
MSDLKFSKDHEWVLMEGDIATVGITDFAQGQLGDVVFVDLPMVGDTVTKDTEAAVVESVKAASEVFAPLSGEVVEVNGAITDDPAKVNQDAEGAAWFFKMRLSDPAELEDLMDADAYAALVEEQG